MKRRISEISQAQADFNKRVAAYEKDKSEKARYSVSATTKNDLYYKLIDFEKEFRDLRKTSERLPDPFVDEICQSGDYPFDEVIDEVKDVEAWCKDVEAELLQDIKGDVTTYY